MNAPLGLGPIVWQAIVFEVYGYHTAGPPFTRAAVEARRRIAPHAMPASAEYYRRIDLITAALAL